MSETMIKPNNIQINKQWQANAFLILIFYCATALSSYAVEANKITDAMADELTLQLRNNMVKVNTSSFVMGTDEEEAGDREKPAHTVTLDGFYIAKTEVTQELFSAVMGWNLSYFKCNACPVNNISWKNMQSFITRLNDITGQTFRLPTEAEWEFAAKGGTKSQGYKYSGSNNIDEVAWYAKNSTRKLHPVGLKKPNELGLYDMTGNVWEFCQDDMNLDLYSKASRVNPIYSLGLPNEATSLKVVRGSGYEFNANESQVYRRDGATSNVRMPDIGFRLAMDDISE